MVNLVTDSFTGTNGSAWSASWATGRDGGGGGTAQIQSNAGRIIVGTTPDIRTARRLTITPPVDAVALFRFQFRSATPGNCFPQFFIRSTNTTMDTQGGYRILMDRAGAWEVAKSVSYSQTALLNSVTGTTTSISKTFTDDTWYWVRFGVVGSAIKARVWNDGSPEPATWGWESTDTTHTVAGSGCGITVSGATSVTFDMDDFSLDTAFPVASMMGGRHTRYFKNYDYSLMELESDQRGFIVGRSRIGVTKLRTALGAWTSIKAGFTSISVGLSCRVVDGAWLEPEVSSLTLTTKDKNAFQTWDGSEIRLRYNGADVFNGVIAESTLSSEINEDNIEEFTVSLTARGFETLNNGQPAAGTAYTLWSAGGGTTPVTGWTPGTLVDRAEDITGRTINVEDAQAVALMAERVEADNEVSGTQGELLGDVAIRAGVLLDQSSSTERAFRSYQSSPVWRLEDKHLVSGYAVAVDRETASAVGVTRKEDETFVRVFRAGAGKVLAERTISLGFNDDWAVSNLAGSVPLQATPKTYLGGATIPRHDDLPISTRLPIRAHFRHGGTTYRGAVIALSHTITPERWMMGIECVPVHLVTRVSDLAPTAPAHAKISLAGTTATLTWSTATAGTVVSSTSSSFRVATAEADGIDVGDELRLHSAAGALKEDTIFVVTAKGAPSGGLVQVSVSPTITATVTAGDVLRFNDYGIAPDGGWQVWYQRGTTNKQIQPNSIGTAPVGVTTYTNSVSIPGLLSGQTYRFTIYAMSTIPNVHSAPSKYLEVVVP